MDFLTVQWHKLDSLPEFFMLVVGIAAIALAIYYIFTRDKNKIVSENNKATIESYKERLEIVEAETRTCHEQHGESLKLIHGLQGKIEILKDIPLNNIDKSLNNISISNKEILERLNKSAKIRAKEVK